MKILESEIKNRKFKSVYLFFGEENYLKNHFLKLIEKTLFPEGKDMINMDVFEGKGIDVQAIGNAIETISLFAEYRLVVIKDSGLFAQGRKNDTTATVDFIKDIPDTTLVVFSESEVDKRNTLYKQVAKIGKAMEFTLLKEGDLINFAVRNFNKAGLRIDNAAAAYFIRSVSGSMDAIIKETEKLCSYVDKEVKKSDIDKVCAKSLETKIFDLIGAVGQKNASKALEIYSNLMLMKESPIMVLSMIARQFRIMLQIKASGSRDPKEISKELSLHSFVVSEAMRQGNNFPEKSLIEGIKDCLSADIAIKTGRMNDRLAVEMLIIKYCSGDNTDRYMHEGMANIF